MHDPKPMEETSMNTGPGYRIPCTCGWVGAWWTNAVKANNAYMRHVHRENWFAASDPPERKPAPC